MRPNSFFPVTTKDKEVSFLKDLEQNGPAKMKIFLSSARLLCAWILIISYCLFSYFHIMRFVQSQSDPITPVSVI